MSDTTGPHGDDRDLDAEFTAMMSGIEIPEDLAGLAAPPADDQPDATTPHKTPETPQPADPADLPANIYHPAEDQEDPLTPEQQAEVAARAAAREADGSPAALAAKAVKVAVVLTPILKAEVLAGLCSMAGQDCIVVPTSSGAVAVKEFVSAHAQWDVSELLGGADSEPTEAAELAGTLSRLSRGGSVLMTADLATDIGIESGLSGTIAARHYVNGKAGGEASAGLLLAGVDQVVEDILLGVVKAEEVPGAVHSSEAKPSRVVRWLGRGLRRGGQGA